jgi:hypothetical protein
MSLETVRTYATAWEAGMAKSILEAEGIPALNDDTMLTGVTGLFYTPGAPGFRVLVDGGQLERAKEVLREWEENVEPLPDAGEEGAEDENEEPDEEAAEDGGERQRDEG